MEQINDILNFLWSQGKSITREVLEDMLEEAYTQGRNTAFHEQVDTALNNVQLNATHEVKRRKQKLLEANFYNKPSTEAEIEMKAYDLLLEILPTVIKKYKE
jgi:dihydroorotase-like cyclic amidohydrolase